MCSRKLLTLPTLLEMDVKRPNRQTGHRPDGNIERCRYQLEAITLRLRSANELRTPELLPLTLASQTCRMRWSIPSKISL